MRRFLILAHTASIDPGFSLNDLPGGAGRMDVLCRAIGAAFFLSHGLRHDVELRLLLQNQVQIRLLGDRLRHLNPDERSTAALLKRALEKLGDEETESTPGIFVSRGTLDGILQCLTRLGNHPVVLHEAGVVIEPGDLPVDPVFVLSDQRDFTPEDETALAELPLLSLGRRPLHTSQCITIIHYMLDREEDEEKDTQLVPCHIVWGEPKALLIKGLLEDSGIPVNLVGHVSQSHLPMTVDGLGEVRIMVRTQDLAHAREIIAAYFETPVDD